MNPHALAWLPAAILLAGCALVWGVGQQRSVPLERPLGTAVPARIAGLHGEDVTIRERERRNLGMTSYLMRIYSPPGAREAGVTAWPTFSLYVAYYARQARGRSIHSPKNCLPGGGWQPLQARRVMIASGSGRFPVNRYLLQHGETEERMLVLYWYQGRGRVVASEYGVKVNLLHDKALLGRSDEALVRVMVPIEETVDEADELAARVARRVAPALSTALAG